MNVSFLSSFSWFPLALVAFACYGVQNFLYKAATRRGIPASELLISFCCIACILCAGISLLLPVARMDWGPFFLISASSAVTFWITIRSRLEALKYLDGSVVFPVVRMQSAVLVIYSLVFLGEVLNSRQMFGVLLALTVIVLSFEKGDGSSEEKFQVSGMCFAFVAMLSSAANVLTCRMAAKQTDLSLFFVLSFFLTALFTKMTSKESSQVPEGDGLAVYKMGSAIALCNVVGAYALLSALKVGPLYAVSSIYNQSFVVSIFLVIVLHQERLSMRRIMLLLAAVVSMFLLES